VNKLFKKTAIYSVMLVVVISFIFTYLFPLVAGASNDNNVEWAGVYFNSRDVYYKYPLGNPYQKADGNNTSSNLSVEVYIQTDSTPTNVSGTSLSWTYSSTTGRIRFYGVLNSGTAENVTILL